MNLVDLDSDEYCGAFNRSTASSNSELLHS